MNYHNSSLIHLFNHLNNQPMDGPGYPYVRSWDERINQRQSRAGGSVKGDDEEGDED